MNIPDESRMYPFFTYGTLRKGESNFYMVEEFAIKVEPAVVKGMSLYDLSPIAGNIWHHAFPTDNDEDKLFGDIIWVSEDGYKKTLEVLDEYESFLPDDLANSEYVRVLVNVDSLVSRAGFKAWIYIGNKDYLPEFLDECKVESENLD